MILATKAVAGFTSLQADRFRRAMSRKRSLQEMDKQRAEFIAGATRNGLDEQTALVIYEKIRVFASFGFPKSHAAAMAVTAFHVAYLKCYYPTEFYCSLLSSSRWVSAALR